jgi:hypothetical protein
MVTNAPKAPAKPVGNLAQARKEQAAARQAQAEAKQRHPAGKQALAKPAAKKPVPAKAAKPAATEQEKRTYAATGRGGVTNTRTSATVLSHAVDVKIAGRKAAHFSAGVVVQMYATEAAATKAAGEINSGSAGPDWTDAVVVPVTVVTEQVSA